MPLDHSKATATISLEGLAISCFNEKTRKWEVGLIREDSHVPRVTVAKVAPDGTISQMTFEIDTQHRIFIDAANAVSPAEPLFKKDPFDRKDPAVSDDEDIRYIVDIEREFNEGEPVQLGDAFPITELFVSEPTLYADQDRRLDDMRLLDLSTQPPTDKGSFGTVSAVCMADIACNDGGGVTLRVDGPLGFSIDLPHIPGTTHGIRIENLCPPAMKNANAHAQPEALPVSQAPLSPPQPEPQPQPPANGHKPSDFSIYFKVVNLGEGVVFDLKSPDGQHGSDAVCNPTLLGTRSSLFG